MNYTVNGASVSVATSHADGGVTISARDGSTLATLTTGQAGELASLLPRVMTLEASNPAPAHPFVTGTDDGVPV